MMKKIFLAVLLLACITFFGGCAEETPEEIFTITAQEHESYMKQIEDMTQFYYWDYDRDSVIFSAGTVPEDVEENEAVFAASAACELPLKPFVNRSAVIAQGNLLHYNGDRAGEFRFYFVNGSLSGVCYMGGYDNGIYSLLERNPYVADGNFKKYETWEGIPLERYTPKNGSLPRDGFVSVGMSGGKVYAVSLVDGKSEIYHMSGTTLSRNRTISGARGMTATSAVFIPRGDSFLLAVLYGQAEETAGDTENIASNQIVLYNNQFTQVNEILLEGRFATAVSADADGSLLVFGEKQVEIFAEGEEGWAATDRATLRHNVTQCHITDMDGDGVKELLMTDGLDLYMYHMTETGLLRLWSTHLGVESLYGAIYSGDLNGDGVKEVYICDATGTTIRYILTETGLRSSNEDIDYGQAIYPCDWNLDGVCDFWNVINDTQGSGELYLSQVRSE